MLEAVQVSIALPDRSRKPLFGSPPLLPILRNVSVAIRPGEAVGVVGESGSGKSTLGRALLRIYKPQSGHIRFEGEDITHLPERELKTIRLRLQMIFQDSQSALNPRHRIIDILAAPFVAHGLAAKGEARERAMGLLKRVGLGLAHAGRYPHQLSGGQRQRIGIARAIALEPSYIVADEIVSGLDVSIQAQILTLLRQLRNESRVGLIFISHDLSVIRTLCDRVAVMRQGEIVEHGSCAEVFARPQHPYTRSLLRSIPLPVYDPYWLDNKDEFASET